MFACRGVMALAVAAIVLPAIPRTAQAQSNDSIQSRHVREADGTTGQDTNSGSGIKTGHLQDGAVTDAKIAGPISRSKLQKLAGFAVVARSGGDYPSPQAAMADLAIWCGNPTASTPCLLKILPGAYQLGNAPLVMRSFVDVEGSGEKTTSLEGNVEGPLVIGAEAELRDVTIRNVASSANVGGGVRNAGALRRATVAVSSSASINTGVEVTSGTSVLEDVSVTVSGSWGGDALKAGGGSFMMRNVRASASGTGDGAVTALSALGAEHWLSNVDLSAYSPSGAPTAMLVSWSASTGAAQVHARGVTAAATATSGGSYGIQVVRGTLWLDGSFASGSAASISAGWAYPGFAYVTSSRLEGGPVTLFTQDSSVACAGVTDEAFVFYPNQCP